MIALPTTICSAIGYGADAADDLIALLISRFQCADLSIFHHSTPPPPTRGISYYVPLGKHLEFGMKFKDSVVVLNAVDPVIFHAKGRDLFHVSVKSV
jgi:hypothetical protein